MMKDEMRSQNENTYVGRSKPMPVIIDYRYEDAVIDYLKYFAKGTDWDEAQESLDGFLSMPPVDMDNGLRAVLEKPDARRFITGGLLGRRNARDEATYMSSAEIVSFINENAGKNVRYGSSYTMQIYAEGTQAAVFYDGVAVLKIELRGPDRRHHYFMSHREDETIIDYKDGICLEPDCKLIKLKEHFSEHIYIQEALAALHDLILFGFSY